MPPVEVDKYSAVGCLFFSCSYHSSGQCFISPDISAWSDPWLAFYPDQVVISTNLISRAGKCLLLPDGGGVRLKLQLRMYIFSEIDSVWLDFQRYSWLLSIDEHCGESSGKCFELAGGNSVNLHIDNN